MQTSKFTSGSQEVDLQQATQLSEMERIAMQLDDENNRMIESIQRLEKIGHKLMNTDNQKVSEQKEEVDVRDGLIPRIQRHIDFFSRHNFILEDLIKKLTPLI